MKESKGDNAEGRTSKMSLLKQQTSNSEAVNLQKKGRQLNKQNTAISAPTIKKDSTKYNESHEQLVLKKQLQRVANNESSPNGDADPINLIDKNTKN